MNHFGWSDGMLEEIHASEENNSWDLADLPNQKKQVGCKRVFMVKVNLGGSIVRLKGEACGQRLCTDKWSELFRQFSYSC